MIGCGCEVCTGNHPRNRRRRPSVQVITPTGASVVIDTGPDFRDQVLSFGIDRVDAVFFTHEHADHVMGFDDVRRFTWELETPLPVYAGPETLQRLRVLYPYINELRIPGRAVPKARFLEWTGPQEAGGLRFVPLAVPHGGLACFGVLIEGAARRIAYIPDCASLPPLAQEKLQGIDVLILNALRYTPHPSHLTLAQSLEWIERLAPGEAYLTHMGCALDYATLPTTLPAGVHMAYDGLELPLA